MTDATANVTERMQFEPFGNTTAGSVTRYGFTGRGRDDTTGLMYYRARWYDAQQSRFLTEDPIGFTGGINLYEYVRSNPLGFSDPMGLQSGSSDQPTVTYVGGNGGALRIDRTPTGKVIMLSGNSKVKGGACPCGGKLPTGGPYVVDNPDSWAKAWPDKGTLVGNGDCVILVETAMGWTMPTVDYWRQGELVKGDNSIKKGTVIATFDEEGRYPNKPHGNHAAIYISQNEDGIQVVDQWQTKRLGANYRTLYWGRGGRSDNGNGFSVVVGCPCK